MEVQTSDKKNLPRRMRYYQSTIDISILKRGVDYKELKASYVIFICNYDEFGRGRYIYTFENTCREEPGLTFGDDAYKVVVNTKGCRGEVSEELMEGYCSHPSQTLAVWLRASDKNQPGIKPKTYRLPLTCVSQKTVHRTVFCTRRRAIVRRTILLQNAIVTVNGVNR